MKKNALLWRQKPSSPYRIRGKGGGGLLLKTFDTVWETKATNDFVFQGKVKQLDNNIRFSFGEPSWVSLALGGERKRQRNEDGQTEGHAFISLPQQSFFPPPPLHTNQAPFGFWMALPRAAGWHLA